MVKGRQHAGVLKGHGRTRHGNIQCVVHKDRACPKNGILDYSGCPQVPEPELPRLLQSRREGECMYLLAGAQAQQKGWSCYKAIIGLGSHQSNLAVQARRFRAAVDERYGGRDALEMVDIEYPQRGRND